MTTAVLLISGGLAGGAESPWGAIGIKVRITGDHAQGPARKGPELSHHPSPPSSASLPTALEAVWSLVQVWSSIHRGDAPEHQLRGRGLLLEGCPGARRETRRFHDILRTRLHIWRWPPRMGRLGKS